MKYLVIVLSIIVLTSCQSEVSKTDDSVSKGLTEDDIYNIINEGYYSYLDSIGREAKIHILAGELLDTNCVNIHINNLDKNKHIPLCPIFEKSNHPFNYFDHYEWDKKKLPKFEVFNKAKLDSTQDLLIEQNFMLNINLYVITRPYKPKGSERIVIQECLFKPFYSGCFMPQEENLVFKKVNNKWTFETSY